MNRPTFRKSDSATTPETPQPSSSTREAECSTPVENSGLATDTIHSAIRGVTPHTTACSRIHVSHPSSEPSPPAASAMITCPGCASVSVRPEQSRRLDNRKVVVAHRYVDRGRAGVEESKIARRPRAREEQEAFFFNIDQLVPEQAQQVRQGHAWGGVGRRVFRSTACTSAMEPDSASHPKKPHSPHSSALTYAHG